MKIQTSDGYIFEGADAKEIVRKMRDTQWGTPVLKRDYMEEVKDRVGTSTMSPIVHDKGADAFLKSLARNGLIRIAKHHVNVTDDDTVFADDPDVNREHSYDPDVTDDEPAYEPDPRD